VSIYSVLVFLHVIGALALFASIGIEQIGLLRLRFATQQTQVKEWVSTLRALRRIDGPAGLLLLATGIYFVVSRWGHQAWAGLAVLGMIVMALLGVLVTGRRLRAIAWEVTATTTMVPPALREQLLDPVLRMSATLRAAIGVGIVFNMVVKPPLEGAVAALVVATVAGAVMAQIAAFRRKRDHAPVASARSGKLDLSA